MVLHNFSHLSVTSRKWMLAHKLFGLEWFNLGNLDHHAIHLARTSINFVGANPPSSQFFSPSGHNNFSVCEHVLAKS